MKIITLFILIMLAVPVQAEVVDRIIAKVGNDAITMSDVAQAISHQRLFLVQQYGKTKGTQEFLKFKKNILNELILQKVLDREIIKESVAASSQEVEQEYQGRLAQYRLSEPALINKLRRDGVSLQEYKSSLKKELEKQKFIQKKIIPNVAISDYDLQKEYEKHISKFQTYTKLSFIEAFLTPDKFKTQEALVKMAEKIRGQLKSGSAATALIRKYSSGPYAGKGGKSGVVESSSLRPEIQNVLSNLKKGQTSNILPIQHGVFIFKLVSKADPKPLPYNKVVGQLRAQFGEKVVQDELRDYLLAAKDQTYVEIIKK